MNVNHPDYDLLAEELTKVRDCVEGAPAVKRAEYIYLPHPSQVDKTSTMQRNRYKEYIGGAEYSGAPDYLRRSLLGKMRVTKTEVELPEKLSYLEQNADGDGMPLTAAIEYAVNNILQTKWHLLVADYKGAAPEGVELSIAEKEALNARATIKQYCREAVVNWYFSVVNGVNQLSWVKLLEKSDTFNKVTGERKAVENYLILALDENGDYYQQKLVYEDKKLVSATEPDYQKVNGMALAWLPVSIVADEELPVAMLPRQLGYLAGVCDVELYNYRVSAEYKETQRMLKPTMMNKGGKKGDKEIFAELNGGRGYILLGQVNNLPEGWEPSILSSSADMADFHWYFEETKKKINALNGRADGNSAMTATEANIIAADQNALLETIADNCEHSFKRMIAYCGMFEGLYSVQDIEQKLDDITIAMPRNFAQPMLTVEQRQQTVNEFMAGLISKAEAQRQLAQGGATVEDLELINLELEEEPPKMQTTNAEAVQPQTNEEAVP